MTRPGPEQEQEQRRTTPRLSTLLGALAGVSLVVTGTAVAVAPPRAATSDIVAADPDPRPAPQPPAPAVPPGPDAVLPPGPVRAAPLVGAAVAPVPVAPPVSVEMPGVRTILDVVPVGVLASGALQLPERPTTLGWWSAGAVPGDADGTVVVAGHVDSAGFGAGPLEALLSFERGDEVVLTDAVGGVHRYLVASRASYPKSGLPPEVFATAGGRPRLALVTCGGAFDERTGHYAENVVVLAEPA